MNLRVERLREVIRETAAELILHDLADPRLGFCTVTNVDLTADLAYCTVYVSVFGDEAVKSKTMRALQDARGLIQINIAKRLKTRTTPHLTIELDESIEKQFSINEKIKEARATDTDAGLDTMPVKVADEASEDDADEEEIEEEDDDDDDEDDEKDAKH